MTADCTAHGEADIGIDIDLTHTILDPFLDLFNGHAVGFFHLTAKLADDIEPLLRYGTGSMHHQVGIRNAPVNLFNAFDGENVTGRLTGEFISAVRGTDGDR